MADFTAYGGGGAGASGAAMGGGIGDESLNEWAKQPAHMRRFSVGARPDLHPEAAGENEEDYEEDYRAQEEMESMQLKISEMSERIQELKYDQERQEDEGDHESAPSSRNEFKTLDSFIRHEESVLIEHGVLYKKGAGAQSGGFFGLGGSKAWKERYFVISDNYRFIEYYKDSRGDKILGYIEILADSYVTTEGIKREHRDAKASQYADYAFDLVARDPKTKQTRNFHLIAFSDEEMQKWVYTLQHLCDAARQFEEYEIKRLSSTFKGDDDANAMLEQNREHAQNCVAYGEGLFGGTAGDKMKFSIRLNDECGCALDLYEQGLSAEDLPFNITLESVDVDEDGTVVAKNLHYDIARPVINEEDSKELLVEYTLMSPGPYQLNVWFEGHPIYGSPWFPTIEPGKTSARQCKVEGDGVRFCHTKGINVITITAHDRFGYRQEAGGDEFLVKIVGPAELLDVDDNGDGTYTVTYKYVAGKRASQAEMLEVTGQMREDPDFPIAISIKFDEDSDRALHWPVHVGPKQSRSPFRPRISHATAPSSAHLAKAAATSIPMMHGSGRGYAIEQKTAPSQQSSAAAMAADAARQVALAERERTIKREEARLRAERAVVDQQMVINRQMAQRVHDSSNRVAAMAGAVEKEMSKGSTNGLSSAPSSSGELPPAVSSGSVTKEDMELFDARVVARGPHAPGLIREVFEYYAAGGDGVPPRGFAQLWRDYQALPTFFEEEAVIAIIDEVCPHGGLMGFQQFKEGLALGAVAAFRSTRMIDFGKRHYPTKRSKYDWLLHTMCLGSKLKLDEIKEAALS